MYDTNERENARVVYAGVCTYAWTIYTSLNRGPWNMSGGPV